MTFLRKLSARLRQTLSGVAAKVKAAGQKASGACVSWWKKRSKRTKLLPFCGLLNVHRMMSEEETSHRKIGYFVE